MKHSKQINNSIKNGQIDIAPEKTYRWPISTQENMLSITSHQRDENHNQLHPQNNNILFMKSYTCSLGIKTCLEIIMLTSEILVTSKKG